MTTRRQIACSALVFSLVWLWGGPAAAQFGGALRGLGKKALEKAGEKKPEPDSKPAEPESKPAAPEPASTDKTGAPAADATAANGTPNYRAYQNYDFVPGDKIVFDDDFRADTDGEFPAHWKLTTGQGVVNSVGGQPAFALTQGNYARVAPRLTTAKYLADPFTVEFDFYAKDGAYDPVVFLIAGDKEVDVSIGDDVSTSYFAENSANQTAPYPGDRSTFDNRWHHAALVFKGHQLKVYEDQYRVLVIPDTGTFHAESIGFGGIGDMEKPLIFTNVRVANGGGMRMIDRLTKEGRIVTHGIQFDVNKSIVKPESMGTIREIAATLESDPSLKLEIDGHTDSDGDAAKNLALSEARAEAVKKILVEQGIDASRLTAKGFGATKPIDSNTTPEGKANNRRVEFVKL